MMELSKVRICLFLVISSLIASKSWHDTLPIFLKQTTDTTNAHRLNSFVMHQRQTNLMQNSITPNQSSAYLSLMINQMTYIQKYLAYKDRIILNADGKIKKLITINALGLTIGALIAGIFTNIFGAPLILPLSLLLISCISFAIIKLMLIPQLSPVMQIFLYILITLRGVFIASSMNASYAYLGILYGNNALKLRTATATLYLSLFLALGFVPKYAKYFNENFYNALGQVCVLLCIGLVLFYQSFNNQQRKVGSLVVEIRNYTASFPLLIKDLNFIALCSISMLCIGGFYNLIYVIRQVPEYINKVPTMQQYARMSAASLIMYIFFLTPNSAGNNGNKHSTSKKVKISLICVVIFGIVLFMCSISSLKYSLLIISFVISFSASSALQIFAKTGIIKTAKSIEQTTKKNLIGSAQSVVTLSNSMFEFVGSYIIFNFKHGSMIYLGIAILLYSLIMIHEIKADSKELS